MDNNYVETVISVAPNLLLGTTIAVNILVLSKHKTDITTQFIDATKTFGNIVTFRDLEQATIDAITVFGDKNTKNVVLEKSYTEYMEGFIDVITDEASWMWSRSWSNAFPLLRP